MHLAGWLRRAPDSAPRSHASSLRRADRTAQGRDARHARTRTRTRGQSLVEFAIALPILLFLTLITLDFGRVYLGWINLQNMSRIAANYAANNPGANWSSPADPKVIAYQNLIRADAAATNCSLPLVGGLPTAPMPTFTDVNGDGQRGIGDTAEVRLTCQFNVITPGISRVVGSSVAVSASSVFPVKAGMTATGTSSGGGGSVPTSAFSGNSAFSPSSLSGVAPFTVVFRDTSGGNPTGWLWNFNDGSPNSSLQDPPDHVFATPGTYLVQMTASNAFGPSATTASMGITVVAASSVDFAANQTSGNAPLAVTFTSTVSPGASAYAWSFGAGEGTATGATANHTYNTAGTFTVSLTVTYPTGPVTQTKTNYISVAPKQCVVPSFAGKKRNTASGLWTGAGFTGTLSDGPGAPNGNGWTMTTQTLTATSTVPCTANIQVNDH